jgi:hypothetical protein
MGMWGATAVTIRTSMVTPLWSEGGFPVKRHSHVIKGASNVLVLMRPTPCPCRLVFLRGGEVVAWGNELQVTVDELTSVLIKYASCHLCQTRCFLLLPSLTAGAFQFGSVLMSQQASGAWAQNTQKLFMK